jgi:hypothetical protein
MALSMRTSGRRKEQMMAKYSFPTSIVTPKKRSYSNLSIVRNYENHPTEKQMKLIASLRATCARVGIDTSDFHTRTKTLSDAKGTIRALYSLLARYGYDGWGNPLVKEEN